MKKKLVLATVCALSAAAMLTACGSGETQETVDLTSLTLDEICRDAG